MKLILTLAALALTTFIQAQTLTLDGSKVGKEISQTQFAEVTKLGVTGSDWSVESFSIFVDLYGRDVEVVSESNEITEEMQEAIVLLKRDGEAPLSFRFDKVVISHEGLNRTLPPVTVQLK